MNKGSILKLKRVASRLQQHPPVGPTQSRCGGYEAHLSVLLRGGSRVSCGMGEDGLDEDVLPTRSPS